MTTHFWETVFAVVTGVGIVLILWSLPIVIADAWANRPRAKKQGGTAVETERNWNMTLDVLRQESEGGDDA